MASAELHIKDSFYFEVPKALWPSARHSKAEFPDVWIKNDPQFQAWEAERLCAGLEKLNASSPFGLPDTKTLRHDYEHWLHADHANFGKPLDIYLEEQSQALADKYAAWKSGAADRKDTFGEWLGRTEQASEPGVWFARASQDGAWLKSWAEIRREAGDVRAFKGSPVEWSRELVDAYNFHLSGKVLIPQPFGELRNLYQGESGFCISKFMILEAAVFVILLVIFSRVGRMVAAGGPPRGRFWNFFESMLVFVRDEIARKAIQTHHHDDHGHEEHGHDGHGDAAHGHDAHGSSGHGSYRHGAHGHADHGPEAGAVLAGGALAVHAHNPHEDADRFVPLLWTIFFFILGCNLMGMLPWMGAPSSSWGATLALALITFLTGMIAGSKRFGFLGYWANQVPSMGLPFVLAILLVPMIFLIEVLGLVIKHTVLSIRLLANMIAGHLVLLAILMLAFSVEGAASASWGVTGFFAVVGSAALSCLELFVAFLQAYVFTLLSALFINAAIHKH